MKDQTCNWSRAAKTINEAGKKLQARYSDLPLETDDIDQEVMRIGSYRHHSVPPSDYCYNLINKAPSSFCFPIFEWLERGKYKYLGPDCNFTGPILWNGKQVGEWKSGKLIYLEDPRE